MQRLNQRHNKPWQALRQTLCGHDPRASRFISRCLLLATCFFTITTLPTACIDEDLSDCGEQHRLEYNVQLHAQLQTNITSVLNQAYEQEIAQNLFDALRPVFSDLAHDVELSFFNAGQLKHYETHEVNANQTSFTIFLPIDNYQHLALANNRSEPGVSLYGQDNENTMALLGEQADTINSHRIGLFTARLPIMMEQKDQTFNVNLYMVNCATAVVIDMRERHSEVAAMEAVAQGFADHFLVNDSVFATRKHHVVRTCQLDAINNCRAFYATTFPSAMTQSAARADGEPNATVQPWSYTIYVTLHDGSVTKNVLTADEPIKAGDLTIVKTYLDEKGIVRSLSPHVGVSVTLDWNEGGNFDVPI